LSNQLIPINLPSVSLYKRNAGRGERGGLPACRVINPGVLLVLGIRLSIIMHNCEWCGKDTGRYGGNGRYYCSLECSHQSRLCKTKLRHRHYLYLFGEDGKRHAVRVNKRPRPDACELCGDVDTKLNYHHWNEDNPSLGMWLCTPCHFNVEAYEHGKIDKYLDLKIMIESQPVVDKGGGVVGSCLPVER